MARPTDAHLRRTRELIERFHLAGYGPDRIVALLAAAKDERGNPAPIKLSRRQVERHVTAIRAGALSYVNANDDLRADLIEQARGVLAEATQGAAAKRGTVLEIANQKLRLEAAARIAALAGIDIRRVQVSGPDGGPVEVTHHPVDELPPAEQARRLRLHAEELEARAAEDDEP